VNPIVKSANKEINQIIPQVSSPEKYAMALVNEVPSCTSPAQLGSGGRYDGKYRTIKTKRYRNSIRTLLTRTQRPSALQRAIADKMKLTSRGQKSTPDIEEYRDTAIVVLVIGMVIMVLIRWLGLALISVSVGIYLFGILKCVDRVISNWRSSKRFS
jgi:Flp pilus assembly protein TadB